MCNTFKKQCHAAHSHDTVDSVTRREFYFRSVTCPENNNVSEICMHAQTLRKYFKDCSKGNWKFQCCIYLEFAAELWVLSRKLLLKKDYYLV